MQHKTGEKCPETGKYEFVRYTDGKTAPAPTAEEKVIPMKKDEHFPPLKSSEQSCYWKKKD